jgi:hypothetical protein
VPNGAPDGKNGDLEGRIPDIGVITPWRAYLNQNKNIHAR